MAKLSAAAGSSGRIEAGDPFVPPKRYGWRFRGDRGDLVYFTSDAVRVYRAEPPLLWQRDVYHPRWRGRRWGNDFQIHDLLRAGERLVELAEHDRERGRLPTPRPGLVGHTRFLQHLHPDAVALSACFRHDSWRLYCALRRAPGLRDIARDNPALAMLIVDRCEPHGDRHRRVRRLARLRRRDILRRLCGEGSEAWVRLLGRIPTARITSGLIGTVGSLVQTHPSAVRYLAHLAAIGPAVLQLAALCPDLVAPSLLVEVAHADEPVTPANWPNDRFGRRLLMRFDDTQRMARQLGINLPRLRSIAGLDAQHDALARRLAAHDERDVRFAPPPIPDTPSLTALRSSHALRQEAREQHNCLAARGYTEACAAGELYVYRMTAPERASVAIARDKAGRWYLSEICGPHNAPVGDAAERAVRELLLVRDQ